jgi:hypothetical protein
MKGSYMFQVQRMNHRGVTGRHIVGKLRTTAQGGCQEVVVARRTAGRMVFRKNFSTSSTQPRPSRTTSEPEKRSTVTPCCTIARSLTLSFRTCCCVFSWGSTPFSRTVELRVAPPAAAVPVSAADADCDSVQCRQRYPLGPPLSCGSVAGSLVPV